MIGPLDWNEYDGPNDAKMAEKIGELVDAVNGLLKREKEQEKRFSKVREMIDRKPEAELREKLEEAQPEYPEDFLDWLSKNP